MTKYELNKRTEAALIKTNYAFYSSYWNDQNFKPKYDIVPSSNGQVMFQGSSITDLKGILEEQGVTIDFSKTPNLYQTFCGSQVTRLPVIDGSRCVNMKYAFYDCLNLVSIDKRFGNTF